jgi:acetyl esterase
MKQKLRMLMRASAVGCGIALMAAAGCAGPQENMPLTPEQQAIVDRTDPQMRTVLDAYHSLGPLPIETLTVADARKQPTIADAVMKVEQDRKMSTEGEAVGGISTATIKGQLGDIPVRIYTPIGNGPYPTLIYFHGGGWVLGGLDAYDASCRAITDLARCQVISVDYRLAPEHKYPAATQDGYDAVQYIMKHPDEFHADPRHIAIGGESAGGNIATAVCMLCRDRAGTMPDYQLLIYPVTDYNFDSESYRANANAVPLDRDAMKWFFDKYLESPGEGTDQYISVLRGNVTGLPPATIITAELDPLESDGQAYAEKLRAAGIKVQYKEYDGVTHEFFGTGAVVDKARLAQRFAAEGLQSAFSQP